MKITFFFFLNSQTSFGLRNIWIFISALLQKIKTLVYNLKQFFLLGGGGGYNGMI